MGIEKLIEVGINHLQNGYLGKAKSLFLQVILEQPNNATCNHLLAIIALRNGALEEATKYGKHAVKCDPSEPTIYNTLGSIYIEQQNYTDAESALIAAIRQEPDYPEFRFNLGNLYLSQHKFALAIPLLRQILCDIPDHFFAYRSLTLCYLYDNQVEEALEETLKWKIYYPDHYEPYYYHGTCLHALYRMREALIIYDKGLAINPISEEIFCSIGACYKSLGNFSLAKQFLEKSLSITTDYSKALYYLGTVYLEQGDTGQAEDLFVKARNLDAEEVEPILGIGCLHLSQGDEIAALKFFDQALEISPRHTEGHLLKASTLLKLRQFSAAWPHYFHRVHSYTFIKPLDYKEIKIFPNWRGQKLLPETALIIWTEQGIGDQIMLIRFITKASEKSERIIVLCEDRLVSLLQRSLPNCQVINRLYQVNLPADVVQCSMGSLLELFVTTTNDLNYKVNYLVANEEQAKQLRIQYKQQYRDKLLVGISWYTNSKAMRHLRNIPLNKWDFLSEFTQCKFISLQYGDTDEELAKFYEETGVSIYSDPKINPLIDLDSFVAQISALDLVISIDNNTVHFSGALGIPTLLLLPMQSDWRWFKDSNKTSWYNGVTLLRQEKNRDWSGPLNMVRELLSTC